jgi:hypothetical protein
MQKSAHCLTFITSTAQKAADEITETTRAAATTVASFMKQFCTEKSADSEYNIQLVQLRKKQKQANSPRLPSS